MDEPVFIETDIFLFRAPDGFQVESLEDRAELVGPNEEFLVVSSYSVDQHSSDEILADFAGTIANAMVAAVDEPDLVVSEKLTRVTAPSGLPIWSLRAEVRDQSLFFDQYSAMQGANAVVVTIEGNYADRGRSAEVEEALYCIQFK